MEWPFELGQSFPKNLLASCVQAIQYASQSNINPQIGYAKWMDGFPSQIHAALLYLKSRLMPREQVQFGHHGPHGNIIGIKILPCTVEAR
mmetsp:Transcript_80419/g.126984  ORF Transcript_80419/g.126984 Transcript_80419/m.126984 type:complete len:90 (+) Transcript_80419:393-662(+)